MSVHTVNTENISGSTTSKAIRAERIWLDGKFVDWDAGQVPLMTHALHYGLGVFEGIRAYKTHDGRLAVFRLREHIQRLFDSAHICLLKIPIPIEEFEAACVELLRQQKDLFANGATCARSCSWATARWASAR